MPLRPLPSTSTSHDPAEPGQRLQLAAAAADAFHRPERKALRQHMAGDALPRQQIAQAHAEPHSSPRGGSNVDASSSTAVGALPRAISGSSGATQAGSWDGVINDQGTPAAQAGARLSQQGIERQPGRRLGLGQRLEDAPELRLAARRWQQTEDFGPTSAAPPRGAHPGGQTARPATPPGSRRTPVSPQHRGRPAHRHPCPRSATRRPSVPGRTRAPSARRDGPWPANGRGAGCPPAHTAGCRRR